jgi:hypothetical protein
MHPEGGPASEPFAEVMERYRRPAAPDAAAPSRAPPGTVVVHSLSGRDFAERHERATRIAIAERLAALKGFGFAGDHDPAATAAAAPLYFVPSDTLVGIEAARALGIRGEDDLFGGVVPHAFVATKAITHPLVAPDARAPAGWSAEVSDRLGDAVLRGFSAFAPEDARRAGARLLERGPVRLKPVRATGGRAQSVVSDAAELDAALAATDATDLSEHGLVLEEALTAVTTHSVGQVRVAGIVATYWGTQRLTPDNGGAPVYGGSDLLVARGGFEALLALPLAPEARLAVAQARAYDEAAMECFPGMFASRRNYDVVEGTDAAGRRRSGVLEQSWRVGGATGAEIAALEAFQADPALRSVRASTVEEYGEGAAPPPPGATVYFRGADDRVGPMTKYATVEPHGDA